VPDVSPRPLTAYELLGVSPQASPTDITGAYRRLLRRHHPDSRDTTDEPEDGRTADADAGKTLTALTDAYAVLHDPARRAAYDRRNLEPRSSTSPARSRAATPASELLRAGPVSWQQPHSPGDLTASPELLGRLLVIVWQDR
jgi:DnaJ-class molecular chaperone